MYVGNDALNGLLYFFLQPFTCYLLLVSVQGQLWIKEIYQSTLYQRNQLAIISSNRYIFCQLTSPSLSGQKYSESPFSKTV